MILKAKHNFIIYPFFKWYSGFIIKRDFSSISVIGDLKDKQRPILLISNHISWWDGFWAMYLNVTVLKRKFHFMMLEEQLRKFWFFNYSGGFSVNKKSKSVVETLHYTSELLKDEKNMVLIFPQGEIQSINNQNIRFENGLGHILKQKENNIQVLFLVNLIDYFSNRKPGIYMHIQEYKELAFDMKSIQESYIEFYAQSVEKQKIVNNVK